MRVIRKGRRLRRALGGLRRKGRSVGFVPTMGFLHEGHLSLVRRCRRENDVTVVSIFVNPLQFGPKEGFRRYPRDLGRDAALLRKEKADFLFTPSPEEFYGSDFQTAVAVKRLSRPLCGRSRPGHFAGVAAVVLKLLNLVGPDRLYLGQKDYQQVRVIEQMVKDMNVPAAVRRVPTIREADGLAMSSRNVYLSRTERREALGIYRAIRDAARFIRNGERNARKVLEALGRSLASSAPHARLDYAEIADAATLEPVIKLKRGSSVLIAAAVFFKKVRLIDNLVVRV